MRHQSLYPMLILMLLSSSTTVASMGGVELPGQPGIVGFDRPLPANDTGARNKYFIGAYAAALYLAERQVGVESLLSVPAANRVTLHSGHRGAQERDGWGR